MIFGISVFFLVCLFFIHQKIEFYKLRNKAIKHNVKVVKYELMKSPMRNDFTKLAYPYVRFIDKKDSGLVRLKYAENQKEIFEIGEVVTAFWSGTNLLYYNAFDRGLYKFLTGSWSF